MNPPIEWLLEGDSWVVYRTRLDLLNQSADTSAVVTARQKMCADPKIQALLTELADWPGPAIASHKNASQLFHKLNFLADIGLNAQDAGMSTVVERILANQSAAGPFTQGVAIPEHFGGSGQESAGWALCDAPLVSYALGKMGLAEHPQARAALGYLAGLVRENGWPCVVSPELGNFRGPGRKQDPCPFATLAMLKALSQSAEWRTSPQAHTGTETLLELWENSATQHPYIFYMGNDFRKLKAPLVWYDLLHVLDVLSLFPWVWSDNRFAGMLYTLTSKMDSAGRFTAESIWTAWKDWEFGQKKVPSRWVTFLAWRVLSRAP